MSAYYGNAAPADCEFIKDRRVRELLDNLRYCGVYKTLSYLDQGAYSYVMETDVEKEHKDRSVLKLVCSLPFAACLTGPALRELRALTHLCHPNIIPLLRFAAVPGIACFQFPKYHCSLFYFKHYARPLSLHFIQTTFGQIASATAYAHSLNVMHRDIKPGNILLGDDNEAVLGDWGLCRFMADTTRDFMTGEVITTWYAPPEVLRNECYGLSADVWSLGMTLLELAHGDPVFKSHDRAMFLEEMTAAAEHDALSSMESTLMQELKNRTEGLDDHFFSLLFRLLNLEPSARPSMDEVLRCPFLQQDYSKSSTRPQTAVSVCARRHKWTYRHVTPMLPKSAALFVRSFDGTPAPAFDVAYRPGWHSAVSSSTALRFIHAVIGHNDFMAAFLLAMHISHVFDYLAFIPKSWMFACVSVSLAMCGPVHTLLKVRESVSPRAPQAVLLQFDIADSTALHGLEIMILDKFGGSLPVAPLEFSWFKWLPAKGPARKIVMLVLSHPSFMQEHCLRLEDVRNLALLAQYGGQSQVLEHLKTFVADCKLSIRFCL
jgi:cyclin-dependent kinase-like